MTQLVKTQRYKPDGRGFDSGWYHLILPAALWPWVGGKGGRYVWRLLLLTWLIYQFTVCIHYGCLTVSVPALMNV